MAKTQAQSVLSPVILAVGRAVTAEDVATVVEMQNWAFGYRPHLHFSCYCGSFDWDNSTAAGGLGIDISTAGSFYEVLRTRIKIAPEASVLVVGARCEIDTPGDSVEVRFVIGSGTADITCDDTHNGTERITTVATSTTGTDWQTVIVYVRRTAGTGDAHLITARCQDQARTSSLPDPTDE